MFHAMPSLSYPIVTDDDPRVAARQPRQMTTPPRWQYLCHNGAIQHCWFLVSEPQLCSFGMKHVRRQVGSTWWCLLHGMKWTNEWHSEMICLTYDMMSRPIWNDEKFILEFASNTISTDRLFDVVVVAWMKRDLIGVGTGAVEFQKWNWSSHKNVERHKTAIR